MQLPQHITCVEKTSYDEEKFHALHIFGYNADGSRVSTKDVKFKPYFYIHNAEELPDSINPHCLTVELSPLRSLDGVQVKKLTFKNLAFLKAARLLLKTTYEDDVNLVQRYIIDKNITFYSKPHITILDIETDLSLDVVGTPKPVMCFTIYSYKNDKYYSGIWRKDFEERSELRKSGQHIIYFLNSEEALFDLLLKLISSELDPDILSGFNSRSFDYFYLIERAKKLGINYRELSPIHSVSTKIEQNNLESIRSISIKGRSIIDVQDAYKFIIYEKPKAGYSLDSLAKELLSDSKLRVNVHDAWLNDPESLIAYNLHDVELTKAINDKLGLIEVFTAIQQVVPIPLDDVFHMSKLVDACILRTYHNKLVFPSKRKNEKKPYSAAYVHADTCPKCHKVYDIDTIFEFEQICPVCQMELVPHAGLYSPVSVLDVEAMYTNIYRTFNISPDTIIPSSSLNNYSPQNITTIDGVHFVNSKIKKGLIPSMLDELVKNKEYHEKKMKEYVSATGEILDATKHQHHYLTRRIFKLLLNSFYGVMGYPRFRLYNYEVVKSVPYIGRQITRWMFKIVQLNTPFTVIYSHTDSMHVFLKGVTDLTRANLLLVTYKLKTMINNSLQEFSNKYNASRNYLSVEVDTIFKSAFYFSVKNRNFGAMLWQKGVVKNGEIDTTGFELIKSDTPKFLVEAQLNIFKQLLNSVPESQIQETVFELVKSIQRTTNIMSLAEPKNLVRELDSYKDNSYHAVAATNANKRFKDIQTSFGKSDKLFIIPVKSCRWLAVNDVVAAKYGEELVKDLDYDRLINKFVENKFSDIFKVLHLNISFDIAQTKLEAFSHG